MMGARALSSLSPSSSGTRYEMAESWGRIRSRKQAGRVSFFLDFRPLGRVWSRPGVARRPMRTLAQAERLLADIRADLRNSAKSKEAVLASYLRRVAPEMTVRVKYQRWLDVQGMRVEQHEIAHSTLHQLELYGKPQLNPPRGAPRNTPKRPGYLAPIADMRVDLVTAGDFEDVDLALLKAGRSPKTRWHVQRTLQTFFRWLKRREAITSVPEAMVIDVPDPEWVPMPMEDQAAALAALPDKIAGAFLAQRYAGLRPSETARLDVVDFDFDTGIATLPVRKAKTRKRARIRFASDLLAWVLRNVDPKGRFERAPLFTNPKSRQPGKRWTVDAMEFQWTQACKAAGVRPVALYVALKHSTATARLAEGGATLEQLQGAYRHASKRSTEKYARAADLAPIEVLDAPKFVADLSLAKEIAQNDE